MWQLDFILTWHSDYFFINYTMFGEIITIGNELLSGRTPDINGWYAAGRLTASGLRVQRITTVGDDIEKAKNALKEAIKRSEFVIITGGLGSTEDDITNEIVAEVLNRPLRLNKEMFSRIKRFVNRRGIKMSPSMEKMAWMPEGSKLLNPKGIVCGFSIEIDHTILFFLPGVPDQMKHLMDKVVIPMLIERYQTLPVVRQRIIKVFGISEPQIAEKFKGLTKSKSNISFGFYPQFPENHITITIRGKDEAEILMQMDEVEQEIRKILGYYVFAVGNDSMEAIVGRLLKEKGLSLSTAESCTGGLLGNMITDVPGSSRYFKGGIVAYSNEAKHGLLDVSTRTLREHGAVSEQTVKEMARGVKELFRSDIAVAISGIAGPEGGSSEKPVGTVFICLASDKLIDARRFYFMGTREQIKRQSAMMALDFIRRYINGYPILPGI